ncbi:MAG TPA: hypothetical protein VN875_14135 [Candidatus Binatus sp.]|nr:hypothetical protein [Candidatus Binatus sp.]
MTHSSQIVGWIRQLTDPDPQKRLDSAMRLYMEGGNLCTPLLKKWIADPEFRSLVLPISVNSTGASEFSQLNTVVGIAVQPETLQKIREANDSPALAEVPPDQDAIEFELHFENHIELDILTTREPGGQGAIAKFLSRFGEGIQQIEIYVRNVDRATEILRSRFGLNPLYPKTRAGAGGTRINFFLALLPEGSKVLIELVEAKREAP